ncbi:hypothetical protein ACWCPM_22505 [Streptomyces sp. NPDC002309]
MTEAVGEAVLTVVSCIAVLGLAMAFFWGWTRNPLAAGGVGGALLAFLAYGGWELMRTPATVRRGRPAGAAAVAFVVAIVIVVYSLDCYCF